jgi:SAM-dependent methyltransferase
MSFDEVEILRVKDYWNSRPCNIRHSTAPIGTKEYFDQVEARKYFVEYHIPGFAQFERWGGKKVLEIGCGIGTDTINFARAGAKVTTVDLSEKSMDLARTRAAVFGLEDRIRFCPGNAEELASFVPVEPYDLIYSFGVIHHTPHPDAILGQLRQYTRPATTIKIMVYHRRSYKVAWILLTEGKGQFWKLEELVAKNSEAQTGCPVTYTRREGRAPQLPHSGNSGGTHLSLPRSRLSHIPLRQKMVFPRDANAAFPRPRKPLRLACVPHGRSITLVSAFQSDFFGVCKLPANGFSR